jgi:hypothetical protein
VAPFFGFSNGLEERLDIQHEDIQHNDTKHDDTQHKKKFSKMILSESIKHHYAECHCHYDDWRIFLLLC